MYKVLYEHILRASIGLVLSHTPGNPATLRLYSPQDHKWQESRPVLSLLWTHDQQVNKTNRYHYLHTTVCPQWCGEAIKTSPGVSWEFPTQLLH